jgi:hypothetical protein
MDRSALRGVQGIASAKRRNLHKLKMFPVELLRPEGLQ